MTSPFLSVSHISGVAPLGAISRKSINFVSPVLAKRTIIKPPPPIPEDWGSHTPNANPTTTAASIAFPPFSKTSKPILEASYLAVETTAFLPVASLSVLSIFPFLS